MLIEKQELSPVVLWLRLQGLALDAKPWTGPRELIGHVTVPGLAIGQ